MSENKRQLQKKETRNKLIKIALEEFSKRGILNTRTIDIAKEAKVSHGTLFSHFSTQEELLIAVINEFGKIITTRLDELVDSNCSLYEVLKAHLTGLIEFEPFYTRLIIERRLLPDEVRNICIMIHSTISFHISKAAEKEILDGTIKNISMDLIYNTWIGLLHYYLTNSDLFSPNESVLKVYGDSLLSHYMALIKN